MSDTGDAHQLFRRNSPGSTVEVSTDSVCLHTLKARHGLAIGNPRAHARGMQAKTSEGLEVLAAVVVTAGLVAGNLVLFSPLRVDNRVQPAPASQTAERP